jgi:ubiquinol-cytochrome c reductase iron-sulfur subunit
VIERVVRKTDINPKAARRAERQVAALFLLSALGTIGFIATYVTVHVTNGIDDVKTSNALLGVSLAVALGGIGAAIIHWVRTLMPADEVVQERHPMRSSDNDRDASVEIVKVGYEETGLPRRSLIKRTLGLSLGLVALSPVVLLRDLGPLPEKKLRTTTWRKGSRLVDEVTRQPIKFGDVRVGGIMTAIPEGTENLEDFAKAVIVLIRLEPGQNKPRPGRENWAYQDHVAYSKICTHVGCPVGLYEQQTHHLLCPCHQSTFDVTRGCKVIFGPAARALPQLPITIDDNGYFIAADGFDQPIGPSFWERG